MGKKKCPYCKKKFSFIGLTSHKKWCKKNPKPDIKKQNEFRKKMSIIGKERFKPPFSNSMNKSIIQKKAEVEEDFELKEYILLNRAKLQRLIRKNVRIIKYQLANWDEIIRIRKKYHKKGSLSPKRKWLFRK